MRYYININAILFLLFFVSCSNDDKVEPLFDNTVDKRVLETIKDYKNVLISSEFGWKAAYQPENEIGVFNIYMKFNEDNTLEVSSDFNNGIDDLVSNYRVGVNQFPELVIENFTTFHSIFDEADFSLNAEFEFIFENVSSDVITFRSKTDIGEKSKLTFVKATPQDKSNIEALRGLDERIEDGYQTDLFFRTIKIINSGGQEIVSGSFSYNFESRNITIQYLEEQNSIVTEVVPIELTNNGFDFVEPLSVAGQEIQRFAYNEMTNEFISNDGGVESIVSHTNEPGLLFYPEVNTFGTRTGFEFYIYFDNSSQNFLRQTSPDFLNLGINSGFNRIDILFNDIDLNNLSYFQFRMINGNTVLAIFERQVIENERIIFNLSGVFSDPPDADTTSLVNIIGLLTDANGWYIERTNESRFISNPSFLLTSAINPQFRFSVYGI